MSRRELLRVTIMVLSVLYVLGGCGNPTTTYTATTVFITPTSKPTPMPMPLTPSVSPTQIPQSTATLTPRLGGTPTLTGASKSKLSDFAIPFSALDPRMCDWFLPPAEEKAPTPDPELPFRETYIYSFAGKRGYADVAVILQRYSSSDDPQLYCKILKSDAARRGDYDLGPAVIKGPDPFMAYNRTSNIVTLCFNQGEIGVIVMAWLPPGVALNDLRWTVEYFGMLQQDLLESGGYK